MLDQAGRQRNQRLALVLSPKAYNERAGTCVVCPIAGTQKAYPFEVVLPEGTAPGAVVADQPHTVSWLQRPIQIIGRVPDVVVADVRAKLKALLQIM
jgi:mRNA interferase MazF